jgi:hypothetical protein
MRGCTLTKDILCQLVVSVEPPDASSLARQVGHLVHVHQQAVCVPAVGCRGGGGQHRTEQHSSRLLGCFPLVLRYSTEGWPASYVRQRAVQQHGLGSGSSRITLLLMSDLAAVLPATIARTVNQGPRCTSR